MTTKTTLWTAAGAAGALLLLLALLLSPLILAPEGPAGSPSPASSNGDPVAAPAPAASDEERTAEIATADAPGAGDAAPAESEGGLALRGRVVDASGAPVTDARVAAGPPRGEPVASTVTDADGRFAIDMNEAGEYLLRAYHPDAGLALGALATTAGEAVELPLVPFAALGGRVIDASAEAPIEHIGISLSFFGLETAETSHALGWFDVERDWHRERLEDGRYRFDALPAGKYHITFEPGAGGYAVPGYFGVRYLEIVLVPGEERLDFDIALERGGAITGRVLDPSFRPVAEAQVNVMSTLHSFRDWPSQRTDAEGRYGFEGLPSGGDYLVVAEHEPFAQSYSESITIAGAKEIAGVDIELVEGRTVAGRVVDENGAGVADGRVSLTRKFGRSLHGFNRRPVQTDPDGAFTFDAVAPGPYNIVVRSESFDDNRVHPVAVGPETGPAAVLIVLRDGRAPGVVAGRVTDRDGRPLSGVRVLISSRARDVRVGREERTDEDGRYRFEGVGKALRFYVSIYPSGYTPAERDDVVLGDEDVDFVLVRPGSVAGRVVDAATGAPVTRFEVRTISYRRDERRGYAEDWIPVQHENGEFLLDDVESPSSSVGVRAEGFAPLQSERLAIEPSTLVTLELALAPGATFSGRVIDAASGRPIAGARVRVHDENRFHSTLLRDRYGFSEGQVGGLEVTGEDGRFAFRALPPGEPFGAAVWSAGHGARVLPGLRAPKELEVALEAEARLEVEVRERGEPADGIAVSIARPGDDAGRRYSAGGTTGREGNVALEGLPSGGFVLEIHRHRERSSLAYRELELRAGETHRLKLELADLAQTTGTVRGTLAGLSTSATVWIQPQDSTARFGIEGCSSEEPEFTFGGLPAGSYVLHVLSGKGTFEHPVGVPSGETLELTVDVEQGAVR